MNSGMGIIPHPGLLGPIVTELRSLCGRGFHHRSLFLRHLESQRQFCTSLIRFFKMVASVHVTLSGMNFHGMVCQW
jgi:hypothetical protein